MNFLLKTLSLFIIYSSSLSSCSSFYTCTHVDNMTICYNKMNKTAFIGGISLGLNDDHEIVLPNKYENYTINQLGGFFGRGVPTSFQVYITDLPEVELKDKDSEYMTDESYIYDETIRWWNSYEVHDVRVSVTLPDSLETIKLAHGDMIHVRIIDDGSKLGFADIWRVVYYFYIDENNSYFYTVDGKLYLRDSDRLMECFIYE